MRKWLASALCFNKVCSVHGKNHPELQQVRASFQGLAQELTMHMMKEENDAVSLHREDGRSQSSRRNRFCRRLLAACRILSP